MALDATLENTNKYMGDIANTKVENVLYILKPKVIWEHMVRKTLKSIEKDIMGAINSNILIGEK